MQVSLAMYMLLTNGRLALDVSPVPEPERMTMELLVAPPA